VNLPFNAFTNSFTDLLIPTYTAALAGVCPRVEELEISTNLWAILLGGKLHLYPDENLQNR